MRAFMSTSDSHLRLPYPSEGLARHYAEQAEIEARHILAETEPARLSCYVVAEQPSESRYYSSCAHGLMGVAARGALAEALTAFVAEGE